jgi:SAM-dependent methyltransferase
VPHYVSLDLESPTANIHADLTHLPFADRAFDAILCSHVLEHVRDDLAAMRECRRVLGWEGCALFLVPLNESGVTDEDPTVTDTDERIQRFGQADHVRFYGLDIMDRLRTAGFSVGRVTLESVYQDGDRDLALGEAVGGIFFCTIPAGQPRV